MGRELPAFPADAVTWLREDFPENTAPRNWFRGARLTRQILLPREQGKGDQPWRAFIRGFFLLMT